MAKEDTGVGVDRPLEGRLFEASPHVSLELKTKGQLSACAPVLFSLKDSKIIGNVLSTFCVHNLAPTIIVCVC